MTDLERQKASRALWALASERPEEAREALRDLLGLQPPEPLPEPKPRSPYIVPQADVRFMRLAFFDPETEEREMDVDVCYIAPPRERG